MTRQALSVAGLAVAGVATALAMSAGLGVGQPGATKPQTDELAADLERRFTQDVAPFIETHCVECHSGDEAKGDLRLDRFKGVASVLKGEVDLRKVREMISTGEMPPKKRPQPEDHIKLIVTQWADAMLAYVPTDAPVDPGWCTPHRLNRVEYRNTLRDLLGVDPGADIASKLPRDDTGYGFDNIADVLSVSPVAIEQYLAAAERAVELGLGPQVEIGDKPRVLRPIEGKTGQALPKGGFFLYSNGPASATFDAPVEGDYIIRVQAWETKAGNEAAHMSVRVGDKSIGEFEVSAKREKPKEYKVRTRLKAGPQQIAAHFTNDFYEKDKADRNLGVESISVAGPIDESGIVRPKAWAAVFDAGKGKKDDNARAEAILGAFASRAYRKPADPAQVKALMAVYAADRKSGRAFEPAVRTAITATLVSPRFLFRTVAHPKPTDPGTKYTLDGYELASRLSYFLWSSMPDEPLLKAAADGNLLTDAGLSEQIKRMVADQRSQAFVENFSGQWLQLRALESVSIDRARFPEYDDRLRGDMVAEATRFFGDVLASNRSVLDLVDSRDTFLNERLATHYAIPGVKGGEFRRVTLPERSPRGGVLTMGAVLTLTSNTTRTSPVKRGLFVLDQMLGAPPPPPPPDIPPLEQAHATNENATVRERLAAHVAVASCAACHNRLDPLGLAFEHFDAIGRWRDNENDRPVDATGTLPGGLVLNGTSDLKKSILAKSDQYVEALASKVLTYALGRGVEPFDRPAVRKIALRTRASGDKMQALIESVVLSETFRTCRGRKPSQ